MRFDEPFFPEDLPLPFPGPRPGPGDDILIPYPWR